MGNKGFVFALSLPVQPHTESEVRRAKSFVWTLSDMGQWRPVVSFFVVRCEIVSLATLKTCQRKLVNSFTPANKTCQGKTRQRKFVGLTHEHMNIFNANQMLRWRTAAHVSFSGTVSTTRPIVPLVLSMRSINTKVQVCCSYFSKRPP